MGRMPFGHQQRRPRPHAAPDTTRGPRADGGSGGGGIRAGAAVDGTRDPREPAGAARAARPSRRPTGAAPGGSSVDLVVSSVRRRLLHARPSSVRRCARRPWGGRLPGDQHRANRPADRGERAYDHGAGDDQGHALPPGHGRCARRRSARHRGGQYRSGDQPRPRAGQWRQDTTPAPGHLPNARRRRAGRAARRLVLGRRPSPDGHALHGSRHRRAGERAPGQPGSDRHHTDRHHTGRSPRHAGTGLPRHRRPPRSRHQDDNAPGHADRHRGGTPSRARHLATPLGLQRDRSRSDPARPSRRHLRHHHRQRRLDGALDRLPCRLACTG